MKNKLTLLLIEDEEITQNEINAYFDTCDDMRIVETTGDANLAISLALAYMPNVILLDLELHYGSGNGLMFLQQLKDLKLPVLPYIIVITQNMSEVTLSQARSLGADFIITKYDKSYSPEYVASTIRLMQGAIMRKNTSAAQLVKATPAQKESLLKLRITREMDLIGINPKNIGYSYLIEAISLYIDEPSTHISRALVKIFHKSEKSIERAMQNAIKRAWDTNDIDALYKYYTAYIRPDKGFPTLMEFICYYSNKIKNDVAVEKLNGKNW